MSPFFSFFLSLPYSITCSSRARTSLKCIYNKRVTPFSFETREMISSSSSLSCFGRRKTSSSLSRRKGIVVQQCKNRNVVTNNLINTKDGRDEDDDRSSSKDNNEKLMMMQAASVAPFWSFLRKRSPLAPSTRSRTRSVRQSFTSCPCIR